MSLVEIEIGVTAYLTPEQVDRIKEYSLAEVLFRPVDVEAASSWQKADAEKAIAAGYTMEMVSYPRKLLTHIDLVGFLVGVDVKILRRFQNRSTESMLVGPQNPLAVRESKAMLFNERVQVAVPMANAGLMAVNDVDVHYDCCTDSLRERMKEGWRILAICPQPDQRRPDYILGRVMGIPA